MLEELTEKELIAAHLHAQKLANLCRDHGMAEALNVHQQTADACHAEIEARAAAKAG